MSNRIFLRAFKKKTCYELFHGRSPKVNHFRVFGCMCFILKKGNLDMFESRSMDGIFPGYANHSRAYRVLNLETNQIMETCKVTFDETIPCSSTVFECAGDEEKGHSIFEDEQDSDEDDGDDHVPDGALVPPSSTTTTTIEDGPSATPSSMYVRDRVEATIEGEAISRREAPRHVQKSHPPFMMIGDLNE